MDLFSGSSGHLRFGMMFMRIFKHFNLSSRRPNLIEINSFQRFTFWRIRDESARSSCRRGKNGLRDDVQDKLDYDAPVLDRNAHVLDQPSEQVTLQAVDAKIYNPVRDRLGMRRNKNYLELPSVIKHFLWDWSPF